MVSLLSSKAVIAELDYIILQSTTSTQNSGLYDVLLPLFTAETGIEVRVVAVGSGQALRHAADCNGEAVIVHDPEAERAFIEAGFANERFELMRNDFVIVGPSDDPAEISTAVSAARAFSQISSSQHPFVSRGDNSGTHSREKRIWRLAGIQPSGSWHRETGAGMGPTLNIAVGMDAYALTDRATWISFNNKMSHRIFFSGSDELTNIYSIMVVNAAHCPNSNTTAAMSFLNWMLSETGQNAIGAFTVDGQVLFKPALMQD